MLKYRRNVLTTLVLCAAVILVTLSCAQDTQKAKRVEVTAEEIGTKAYCPVTGDSFTVHKQTPVVQYKGERYYMCCPGCDTEFQKDPERYIKQMEATEHHKTMVEPDMIGAEVVCPVSGDRFHVSETTPVFEYEGKKYYLCCPGCELEFKKDPEKYIELLEKQPESHNTERGDEILYWTCSMHPEVKSDVEGNCPICAMALIPVYEHGAEENVLKLTDQDFQLAGIRMVPAMKHHVYKVIQTVGEVAYDPMLVIAQEEFINALEMLETLQNADQVTQERAATVVERAHYKLRLLGMDESEISELQKTRTVARSLVIPDQETWVYARIYESDMSWVKKGQVVSVTSVAYPGETFHGTVRSVNPLVDPHARSVEARVKLHGVQRKLKPGMYINVSIEAMYIAPQATHHQEIIAIPRESVLDTGNRKVVWVYVGDGNFQPREVTVGPLAAVDHNGHMARYYPVLEGIAENEMVVTNGNFLIDSESQITGVAALGYGGALGVDEQPQPPIHQH